MPRNVRPLWVDIGVSTRKTLIGTGPRSKNGSLYADFYVREDGCIVRSVSVRSMSNGKYQRLIVTDPAGNVIFEA